MTIIIKDTLTGGLKQVEMFIQNAIINGGKKETKRIAEESREILRIRMTEYTPKVPRKTLPPGKIGENIVYDVQSNSKGFNNVFFAFVNENIVPYAKYVEEGHGSFEGYRFMAEAYQRALSNLEINMATHIRNSLDKIRI